MNSDIQIARETPLKKIKDVAESVGIPRDEVIGSTRFLNPGCISRPNRGAPASWAWLTLEEGQPIGWRLVPV